MDDELIEVQIFEAPRQAPARRGPVLIDLTSDTSSPPAARHDSPRPARRVAPSPSRGRARGRRGAAADDDEAPLPHPADVNNPVIDLTGDDAASPPHHHHHHQQRAHQRRGRSPSLDPDDIIILRSHTHTHTHTHTTNARDRDRERERQRLRASLFPGLASYFPALPEHHMRTLFQEFAGAGPTPGTAAAAAAAAEAHRRHHHRRTGGPHFDPLVHLDYQRAAFGHHHHPPHHHPHHQMPPGPAAAAAPGPRPKVEMPPPAEGFTRDTGEELVVVCPACGGELEYDPARCEGKKKKRDKGEHHFWAVKACGHVYCQPCFDNKRPTTKSKSNFRSLDGTPNPAPQSKVLCAVDDCPSDVTHKGAWVGIYL